MARRLVVALSVAAFAAVLAPPASACAGEVCEAINLVCYKVFKHPCVR